MTPRRTLPLTLTVAASVAAVIVLGAMPGGAQPTGGQVVGGSATISGAGTSSVIVNQTSDRAIINWTTFNVNAGGSATFNQPGSSSITLNRVTGGLGSSFIDGQVTANGRVFIINRDGILIGRNAVINTAGFLATTNDIHDSDFMAGRMNFNTPGRPDASVVNLGRISASSHGFAALVAPGVRNSGTITARLGTVALASGNSFTLDMYGDRLIQLAVGDEVASKVIDVATGKPLSSLVTNDGTIRANGGRVELTAVAARAVVDSVINNRGVIEANSIGKRNGKIVLGGATVNRSTAAGKTLPRQTVKVSGRISARGNKKGTKGGTIQITGEDIVFAAAMLDTAGRAGGGKILVGGDYGGGRPIPGNVNNASAVLEGIAIPTATTVTVDAASRFDASATEGGQGGKVIFWSDAVTTFAGTAYARGGELFGDGGFVEISGKQQLAFSGAVDTSATHGRTGTLLLDPHDVTISTAASAAPGSFDSDGNWIPSAAGSNINIFDLQNQLALSNVVVTTTGNGTAPGDITVQSSFSWSGDNSLTLSAHRNIQINDGVTITHSGGTGSLTLRADSQGAGVGTITMQQFTLGARVDFTMSDGRVSFHYNPPTYASPTNYTPTGQGSSRGVLANPDFGASDQFTAYMLVNSGEDLQAIGASIFTRAQTYSLGKTIDLQSFSNFEPIAGFFTGVLDGNGGLGINAIQNLTITSSTTAGLFVRNEGGTIRNIVLTNVNITGTGDIQSIGALAGQNTGTIENAHASGTVSGQSLTGGLIGLNLTGGLITRSSMSGTVIGGGSSVGGLADHNDGTIENSWSTATVIGNDALFAGGLVGLNQHQILRSFASGPVSGNNTIGGLAGGNNGTIADSFAIGAVSGNSTAGGLVGFNSSTGIIEQSYATGYVTGGNLRGGLVAQNIGTVTNSFWDRETSGMLSSAGSPDTAGLTTIELQHALNANWDAQTWRIVPGVSYPYLAWQFADTPQVISGTVFTDRGFTPETAGTAVFGVVNGTDIASALTGGSVRTGANGYYYFLLAPGTIPAANGQVITYVDQPPPTAAAGAAFQHDANGSVIGLDIYRDFFHTRTAAGTLTDVTSGRAVATFGNTALQGIVNPLLAVNQQIDATGSSFLIDSAVNVSGTLVLRTDGTIGQSQAIAAPQLGLIGDDPLATFALDTANNQVGTLAADMGMAPGSVSFRSDGSYAIGTVAGISGINAGALVLTSSGTVTQSAPMNAGGLGLLGDGGTFILGHTGNQIGTLAADVGSAGSISLTDNSGIVIGSVNPTGVTAGTLALTSTGAVTQTHAIVVNQLALFGTGGNFTLDHTGNQVGNLTANTQTVRLANSGSLHLNQVDSTPFDITTLVIDTAGSVLQTAPITVAHLALIGGGNFGLDHVDNAIGTLAADATLLGITANSGLVIGTVGPTSGVHASVFGVSSTGTVTQSAAINSANLALLGTAGSFILTDPGNQIGTLAASTGSVSIASTGTVTQIAPIVVSSLSLSGNGTTYALNHIGNIIGTLAADVGGTGSVSITSHSGLNFGPVNVDTLVVTSTGTVTQSAAINSANLALLGTGGSYALTNAGNQIATLAANTGAVSLTSQGDLTIGTVASVNGITTTGTLTIEQIGSTIFANSDVSVGAFNLIAGNWQQVGALPSFQAGDFRIGATASFLRASGGDGSASNPYSIADVYGLQGISGALLGKAFRLANAIDASTAASWNTGQGFAPIGGIDAPFFGSLDGGGHTISNLTVAADDPNAPSIGLFGAIGPGGAVSNLTLANATISAGPNQAFAGILAGMNTGAVSNVSASGMLNAGDAPEIVGGGLIGLNAGTVVHANATTDVTVGNGIAGGLVGFNIGAISLSHASGSVTGGAGSILGGFVGLNAGTIDQSYATGAVAGGDDSLTGGFGGFNVAFNVEGLPESTASGLITHSYALGSATIGDGGFAGSFLALNLGSVDQVYGAGLVQGGPASTLGGLIAAGGLPNAIPDFNVGDVVASLPTGAATAAFWDMQTTGLTTSSGGVGLNTAVLAGGLPPGFDPNIWSSGSYPILVNLGPQDTTPGPPVIPPVEPNRPDPQLPPANQQISSSTSNAASPNTDQDAVNTQEIVQQFQQQAQAQQKKQAQQQKQKQGPTGPVGPGGIVAPQPIRLDVGENRHFYLPPPGETQLMVNEVVLQLPCNVPPSELSAILKQHNLTVLGSQCLQAGGNAAYRVRHASNRQIADVIKALAANQIVAAAQANYLYTLQETTTVQAVTSEQGDPGQYVPEKLRLADIHRTVRGADVPIAVIDSEIDGTHPDLSGAISGRFDATGMDDPPHAHGTGMAGAIVSRQRLLGIAPGARIFAIRAFSIRAASAESTTFNILKGIDWAVDNNVRIINMSFAGPRDPSLERALKAAHDKGLILIAAAGNAGPRSPPLYPAADPHVIAVTATDIDDRLFTGANRGTHVAIAAPGVDILVPAPAGEYQVTTGTSVATAHISGVVALMLERNPKLRPADIRKILQASAKRLGPSNQYGAGLVDPVRALEMATPRSAAAPRSRR